MVSQSSSVGYTIMGKTADLTVVQKTTIDTLHKEGKTQKVIAKETGCSQSSVSKHINREAKGRKRCGRKKCTSNRDNRTLERIVKQNPFKNVGEIHKEWTAAGVSASRTTTHRRMQDMGFSCRIPCVKPLLNNRQRQKRLAWAKDKKDWTAAEWSKVMFSDESQFCISFGNQGPRVWRKRGEAQNHGIENLWGIVKRKMRYARPNNAEELKATIRATWTLITPEQCHRLIDSMPRRIAAVIQAKGAPTKYWVLYILILFMFILFSWLIFLKILSLYWS